MPSGGVRPVGLSPVELGIRRRLHELVVDAVHEGPVLLRLRPLLRALQVGTPRRVLPGSLLVALPAPDVDHLVALLAEDRRPETDQAEPVLLPLVHREAAETVEQGRQLAGGHVISSQFVEHGSPRKGHWLNSAVSTAPTVARSATLRPLVTGRRSA